MVKISAGLITYRGKILLLLRDNIPEISDPNCWSFIGGHVEEGESFSDALIRELSEEIGIKPKNFSLISKLDTSFLKKLNLYHIPLSDQEVARLKKGTEGQKIEFFQLEDLSDLQLTWDLKYFYQSNQELFKSALSRVK